MKKKILENRVKFVRKEIVRNYKGKNGRNKQAPQSSWTGKDRSFQTEGVAL